MLGVHREEEEEGLLGGVWGWWCENKNNVCFILFHLPDEG